MRGNKSVLYAGSYKSMEEGPQENFIKNVFGLYHLPLYKSISYRTDD